MSAKRNRQVVREARRERKAATGRVISQKHLERRAEEINNSPLVPLTERQRQYMKMIGECATTIAIGYAGTSKTYIPTVMACDMFRMGEIDKIVFSRPNISNSKSLGFFGGGLVEKMTNWLMPVINILRDRLGQNTLEVALKEGNIEFVPLEVAKGYSAENCFFIVDEAEDMTYEEAKMIVTRQGKNCRMVLAGDIQQSALKEKSGLRTLIEVASLCPFIDLGIMDFNNKSDIVRSESCKNWIIGFERYEEAVNG